MRDPCHPRYEQSLYSYPNTLKGMRQQVRNQSIDIWKIMGHQFDCHEILSQEETNFHRTQPLPRVQNDIGSIDDGRNNRKRSVSFKDEREDEGNEKSFQLSRPSNTGRSANRETKSNNKYERQQKSKGKNKQQQPIQLTQEQLEEKQRYLRECYSIQKYLDKIKPYTRQMPNSAMRLFYEKPCLESYGRKNTSGNNGFIYNDYLKTHNVQPHRHQNQPKKYQTYRSSLNFGKRTKLDPQDRWKKIHRQMSSKLDLKTLVQDFSQGYIPVDPSNLQQMLKFNINSLKGSRIKKSRSVDYLNGTTAGRNILSGINLKQTKNDLNSTVDTSRFGKAYQNTKDEIIEDDDEEMSRTQKLKRSKSWGKKEYLFLYKYKNEDGDIQYAKDRHGITCYVDPTFEENKQVFTKYLRKRAPIEAEDVRPEDRNIDKIMVANYLQAKQDNIQSHYLMPNCDEPYRPQKYSSKAWKKRSAK